MPTTTWRNHFRLWCCWPGYGRCSAGRQQTEVVTRTSGSLRLDPRSKTASRTINGDTTALELTSKEYAIIEVLVVEQGQVVSKADIMERVWDFGFDGDPNIVEVYIRSLRKKIDLPFDLKTIETVRGAGYRLVPRYCRRRCQCVAVSAKPCQCVAVSAKPCQCVAVSAKPCQCVAVSAKPCQCVAASPTRPGVFVVGRPCSRLWPWPPLSRSGALAMLWLFRSQLVANLDTSLSQDASSRADLIDQGADPASLVDPGADTSFVWIGTPNGETIVVGGPYQPVDLVPPDPGPAVERTLLVAEIDPSGREEERELQEMRVSSAATQQGLMVVTGAETESIDETVGRVGGLLLIAVPATTLLVLRLVVACGRTGAGAGRTDPASGGGDRR